MDLVKAASAKGVQARKQRADGFAAKVITVIEAMRAQGKSLRQVAAELERLEVKTARGGKWTATAVNKCGQTPLSLI